MSTPQYNLFVACAPGLEPWLCRELVSLGLQPTTALGGADVPVDAAGLYRVLLGCGVGLRVLLRVASFRAVRFAQLERELCLIEWARLLPQAPAVAVRVTARKSRLYHSSAIAERVLNVLANILTARAANDDADASVFVRMDHDTCTVSLDLCGSLLSQRGYRLQVSKAPLREDLARALLLVAGYDGSQALVDPLCGSGTIAIEGASLSLGLAPGRMRSFSLRRWPMFDAAVEQCVRDELTSARGQAPIAPIISSDRDPGAIVAAKANAERADGLHIIQLECRPLGAVALPEHPGGGLIVCNPPYGKRIGNPQALRNLYAALGKLRRSAPPGYRLAIITSDPALADATGVKLRSALMTDLGGLKVRFYLEN